MLHWSHTVSLRASSTLVRAAHSFFFAVVRDNLQCIYRWEKDPYGKSFCIWTEGANGAHSLVFFSWDTTNTFQQEVPICLLLKEALWTPQVSSRVYLLVLSAKAEELTWSRGAPWGALTMCFKSQHIVLRKALPLRAGLQPWCQSPAQALPDPLDSALSHSSCCAFPFLLLGTAAPHRSVPALIDPLSDLYCTHPKSISCSGISWKRQRCMKLPCWLF